MSKKREDLKDSTGLSQTQKQIISTTWITNFRKDLKYHGCEIFMRLFTKHPEYVQHFNFTENMVQKTELMENKAYQAHCITVMMAINNLIEFALDDPTLYISLLHKYARNHFKRKITSRPVEHLLQIISDYILESFKRTPKPEVEDAWNAFIESIFKGFLEMLTI